MMKYFGFFFFSKIQNGRSIYIIILVLDTIYIPNIATQFFGVYQ